MRAEWLLRKRGPDADKTPPVERREARFRFAKRERRASQARRAASPAALGARSQVLRVSRRSASLEGAL